MASDRRPSPWPERCLVVSNHQSYLDIIVLAAHFPVRFVAKKEVRNWPILGLMTQLSGAIFIDRSNARNSLRCGRAVTQSLQENLSVLIFPEGTSTNGTTVLPFKPMLFSAAAKANASVLPLTLHYEAVNGEKLQNRDLCCWHGDMNFFSHFWNALALRQITTSLEIHAMLAEPQHLTSQELAARAHETVSRALPGSTSNHAVPSVQSTEMDASSEFLWGAVILALLNYEQENLQQVEYGETQ